MRKDSPAARALRTAVQRTFELRGYRDVEARPDFVVAVYSRALGRVDLSQWPAGYPYSPEWWWSGMPSNATGYDEGTVLVDVLAPESLDLLWRGSARATLGPDPQANSIELQKAAAAIIAMFPKARGS